MVNYQAAAYGAMNEQHLDGHNNNADIVVKPPWHPRKRYRMNIVGICVSFFVPWGLFCLLYANLSFRVHYKYSEECWALVGLAALVVLGFGLAAVLSLLDFVTGKLEYNPPRVFGPTWSIFIFLTSLLALVMGPWLGYNNFWSNMQPYYNLMNLNDYVRVDPSRMRGQQMMDAGRVTFMEDATVDLPKAFAFKDLHTYCVAPITMYNKAVGAPTPLFAYDFWAVGMNCCGGNSTHSVDFKCGAYNSPTAHQGLRLMYEEERAFFRLAVQQAESAHMLTATHPLFFVWTEDATIDMNNIRSTGYKWFAIWLIVYFFGQLALVSSVAYVFSSYTHQLLL